MREQIQQNQRHVTGMHHHSGFLKSHVLPCVAVFLLGLTVQVKAFQVAKIKVNQIGFQPEVTKLAVVPGGVSGSFTVVDHSTGETVFTGTLSASKTWSFSQENVAIADFSGLKKPGTYRVVHETAGNSAPFVIGRTVYNDISKAAIKALYYNRASTALLEKHAGRFARAAGHPDNRVQVHASAATTARPAGFIFASSKGWYDAGDYNKYIVNSGISTYTLLAAWEHYPQYYRTLELNIPESGNAVPDLLDEARWNLDWMITMQDPNDGGVYHKLTSAAFSGVVMPSQNVDTRYAVMKTTAAALNFAAVMAVSARVYREFDAIFADSCLKTAEKAWNWAVANPAVYYRQPTGIATGEYGDGYVVDEFYWAAAELYITTKKDSYWSARDFNNAPTGVPSWQAVGPLAFMSLAFHADNLTAAANKTLIRNKVLQTADQLRQHAGTSAYRVAMGTFNDFVWGSNASAANQAMILLQAHRLTGNAAYLQTAAANVDYLLGRNATGYSFVTGFGTHSTRKPHHRPSAADNIADPIPGFLAGGPQNGKQDGCTYPASQPATCYLDDWCSYSTNEVAINWNAPLIYILGALDYHYNVSLPTGNEGQGSLEPRSIQLFQNYPNPFNPSTVIPYRVASANRITIDIIATNGQIVHSFDQGIVQPGDHSMRFNAGNIASGLYIYRVRSPQQQLARTMLFIQ
jgi:endoglucanase